MLLALASSCARPAAALRDQTAAVDEGDYRGQGLDRHAEQRGELFHEVVEGEQVEAALVREGVFLYQLTDNLRVRPRVHDPLRENPDRTVVKPVVLGVLCLF